MKTPVLIAMAAMLVVSCGRDAKTASAIPPTELAASLNSTLPSEVVKAQLQTAGWSRWTIIESPPDNDRRPALQVLSVETQGTDRGVAGTMRLDFLDDRLMATWFYPTELAKYRDAVAKAEKGSNTSITQGTDYKGRSYVVWEDVRLRKELDNWIRSKS